MRKFIMLSVLAVFSVLTINATSEKHNDNDPFHLVVEGKFLSQKHVSYTVYVLNSKTGAYDLDSRWKGNRYFYVQCNVGEEYLVKFEDKNHDTKYLKIDASQHGYFEVDVDFSKNQDAQITMVQHSYKLQPMDLRSRPLLAAR